MREDSRLRRMPAAVAAILTLGVVVAPAAVAEPADWEGSEITSPDGGPKTNRSFPITGTFRNSEQAISRVEVDFGRMDDDVYDPADGDECVPEDPGLVRDTPGNGLDRYDFRVEGADGNDVVWPCNGRFLIRAVASAEGLDGTDEFLLSRTIEIAMMPPPVEVVDATANGENVRITWEGVDDESPDALGYRVERAGPAKDGEHGPYIAVSNDLATGARAAIDQPEVSGDYRYRVLALRRGADEPITSAGETSATADVAVTVATTTTTTTGGDDSPSIPGIGSGRGAPRAPRGGAPQIPTPSPTTTLDTGYEDELDYGEREELAEPRPLADGGEGQAIIRTEGDGAGLMAPAAGALVLLGWAGHVVYLNRLAKQF